MYAVIFTAKIKQIDDKYSKTAANLREIAMKKFGCCQFVAANEGDVEIAISYWPDLDSIHAWKSDAQHTVAQQYGQQAWYQHYQVDVTKIERSYQWSAENNL